MTAWTHTDAGAGCTLLVALLALFVLAPVAIVAWWRRRG